MADSKALSMPSESDHPINTRRPLNRISNATVLQIPRKISSKAENSNPVAPTIFRNEPFGEHVEGLSYYRNESCVIEAAVQTDNFKDSSLCRITRLKPFVTKSLRKFKHFDRHATRQQGNETSTSPGTVFTHKANPVTPINSDLATFVHQLGQFAMLKGLNE